MSTVLPLKTTVGRFPLNYNGKPKTKFRDLIRRLHCEVDGVITGQNAGSEPTSDQGVWVNGTTIELWDPVKGEYSPQVPVVKSGNFTARARADVLTANRTVTLPDKGGSFVHGVIATLEDAYVPRVALPDHLDGTWIVHPELYDSFYSRLSGDITTVVFSTGIPDGKKITIGLLNNGTAYTVGGTAWNAILWPGGTTPTQPVAGAGGFGLGIYTIWGLHGASYGVMKDASPGGSGSEVFSSPPVPRNYGGLGGSGRAGILLRLQ